MNNSRKVSFGIPKLEVLHQNDGSIIIKNIISPDEWPSNIILKLIHWSTKTPETIFLAKRNHLNYLIGNHTHEGDSHNIISVPSYKDQRGNPVIWGEAFFPDLGKLEGDTGGRALFSQHPAAITLIEMQDDCVVKDTNTPEAIELWLKRPHDG